MVFSSNLFLFIFLPITLLGYYLIRKSLRNIFLLIMSLGFYAWGEPKVVFIMIASILINYGFGLLINFVNEGNYSKTIRVIVLIATVSANLGMLFYYKYFDFAIKTINSILGTSMQYRNIALPIGISFFTFQGMSYVLDLYMGNIKVQRNPLNIALYISLFPQLIAGPIVRYIDVNDQIDIRNCDMNSFSEGIRRFSIGLCKKSYIANTMALVADNVFNQSPFNGDAGVAWVGAICYGLQIYFDFSGYSDMAIGLGKMFGFDFLENFNYPYIAKNITDFWRRWHISLSTWFRDYVYIPLGGNRRGNQYFNLLVVFMLTGLWHGASWNYVLWGLWHGAFLMIEKPLIKKGIMTRIPSFISRFYTLLVVLLGWVLFRLENMADVINYLGTMFGFIRADRVLYTAEWYLNTWNIIAIIIAIIASIPMKSIFKNQYETWGKTGFGLIAANIWTIILLVLGVVLCMTSTYNPFIYFRF